MKNRKLLCILLLSGVFTAQAQNVTYKTIKDQPDDVANFWVNFELVNFEMPLKNFDGTSFNLGLNSVVNYRNKLGAEATFRRSYLTLGKKPRLQFEIGGFYNLASKTKIRSQKVVLDSKSFSSGGKKYTETTFIKAPATIMTSYGVRAGFDYNREFLGAEMDKHGFDGNFTYQFGGLYLGGLITKQMNMRINTDSYGTAGAAFVRRYYVDVLINPIRKITDNATEMEYTATRPGIFGFRAGIEALPAEPRKLQGHAMYYKIEVGMRPMDGVYLLGSFGFNFKRKIPALGVFKPVREKE